MRILYFLICFLFTYTGIFADISVYLNPRVEKKNSIIVNSLGIIEGSGITDEIRNTVIPVKLYKDGYIDQNEIRFFLKEISGIEPVVYGTAIRIIEQKKNTAEESRDEIVKKNDTLIVTMQKGRIKITFSGRAMSSSSLHNIIPVKLKNNKIIKVKVLSSGRGMVVR